MGHGPATFKESDITRIIKAVRKAGAEDARVEIDTEAKKITIYLGKPTVSEASDGTEPNEWDEIHGDNQAASRQ
jgi:hypothetical protein